VRVEKLSLLFFLSYFMESIGSIDSAILVILSILISMEAVYVRP
jgi:hypothetical protein